MSPILPTYAKLMNTELLPKDLWPFTEFWCILGVFRITDLVLNFLPCFLYIDRFWLFANVLFFRLFITFLSDREHRLKFWWLIFGVSGRASDALKTLIFFLKNSRALSSCKNMSFSSSLTLPLSLTSLLDFVVLPYDDRFLAQQPIIFAVECSFGII